MKKKTRKIKERRKFPRVGIYAVTRYFCPFRDMEVGVQTRISDISEGGARLVTFLEGVPVGAPVKISFVMPGTRGALISVQGIARHTEPFGEDLFRSGVAFRKLKKRDFLILREYVASQLKK
jgi:hypothetical protein